MSPSLPDAKPILLVEDEHTVRTVAARALLNQGYAIHEASNGEGAMALLAVWRRDPAEALTERGMQGEAGQILGTEGGKRLATEHDVVRGKRHNRMPSHVECRAECKDKASYGNEEPE